MRSAGATLPSPDTGVARPRGRSVPADIAWPRTLDRVRCLRDKPAPPSGPATSLAPEFEPVQRLSLFAIATGAVALALALVLYLRVKSAPEGNAQMQRIARYIRDGAMAFLWREYKVLAVYAAVVSSVLFIGFNRQNLGVHAALSFLSGAFLSL